MSLGYILNIAGRKMGLDPTDVKQRATLLRFANEAALEFFDQADPPGSLMELPFKVNGDQTITVPHYVGEIRGVRELASMQVWHLNQMRPRYYQFNWSDMWRNIRLKYQQALQNSIINQSVVTLSVAVVETPPIVVTLVGPTPNASSTLEIITMDSLTKTSTNTFLDIISAQKDRVNTVDVTVKDVDARVLTIIPNNELQSVYQIIDVSSCPWLPQNTSPQDNYLELLYKRRLFWLQNDSDEIPAINCDYVVINKMAQLWAEQQEKVDIAKSYDDKATRTLARKIENENRATEDMVALVANPHDTLLKRVGSGLRRRYSLYAGRKY